MKKVLLGICLLVQLTATAGRNGADYLNAQMFDLIQYERLQGSPTRKPDIINAFKNCTDPEIKQVFINNDYFDVNFNNGQGTYVKQDSLKWNFRLKNTCYMDIDGDGQREIIFHERNPDKNLQCCVLLKKQGNVWHVLFKEYGVFVGVLFEGSELRGLNIVEYHQFANPCNIFKLYKATAGQGKIEIIPRMKIHVPHYYHLPIKVEAPSRTVNLLVDTLFFYDVDLYNQMDFPYKKEMRNEFLTDRKFNSHESEWFYLVPSTIYWVGFVESRGNFSSLLVAFNYSYATDFPEYLFLYVPNQYFSL